MRGRSQMVFPTARGLALGLLVAIGPCAGVSNASDDYAATMPAGTVVKFHVDSSISSSDSKTGQTFSFELLEPIVLANRSIPVEGTTGFGTVFLAGHAGSNGHEGDLTLRLDSLQTSDGATFSFADQRFQINGRNRKVTAGVLGFVPFVGVGARLIRGSDVSVDSNTPIETVLARPAILAVPTAPANGAASP